MNPNPNSEPDPWFLNHCRDMKNEYGWGWKRRLAKKVGVRESNVQSWLKSQRVPAAVRRAIELSDELDELRKEKEELEIQRKSRWIEKKVCDGKNRYSVHEMVFESGLARKIAGEIDRLEDAHEIAGINELKRVIDEGFNRCGLEDRFDQFPEDIIFVRDLKSWPRPTAGEREAEYNDFLDKEFRPKLKEMFKSPKADSAGDKSCAD